MAVDSTNMSALGSAGRDAFRAEHIGYIFQMFNLIPYLSHHRECDVAMPFLSRKASAGIVTSQNPRGRSETYPLWFGARCN